MKFACLFGVFILFSIFICDSYRGQIDRKEKLIYSLICSFFCGAITAEIVISYLRERAIKKIFGDCAEDVV